jgi:hypothetical protein
LARWPAIGPPMTPVPMKAMCNFCSFMGDP